MSFEARLRAALDDELYRQVHAQEGLFVFDRLWGDKAMIDGLLDIGGLIKAISKVVAESASPEDSVPHDDPISIMDETQ